ncbi:hypothetical protein llap_11278 [Limosa lapponica baueri]|uniref:Uncharacterized protein n=1 Tax=Limosa lapponica baueri TaxID=1758121 RepID=A0A2I0TXC0_LIMLA|nr:hypothetical protein llap_11278 [Limosa lapponica baueri]
MDMVRASMALAPASSHFSLWALQALLGFSFGLRLALWFGLDLALQSQLRGSNGQLPLHLQLPDVHLLLQLLNPAAGPGRALCPSPGSQLLLRGAGSHHLLQWVLVLVISQRGQLHFVDRHLRDVTGLELLHSSLQHCQEAHRAEER